MTPVYTDRGVGHAARPQRAPTSPAADYRHMAICCDNRQGSGFVVYSLIHPKRVPDDGLSPTSTVDAHRADLHALDTMCSHHGADAPEWFPVRPAHPCSGDNSSPCCQPEPARAASPVSRPGPTIHESSPTTSPTVGAALKRTSARGITSRRNTDMDVQALDRAGPVSEQPIRFRGDATPTTVEQGPRKPLSLLDFRLMRPEAEVPDVIGQTRPHPSRPRTDGLRSTRSQPERDAAPTGPAPGLTYSHHHRPRRTTGGGRTAQHRSEVEGGARLPPQHDAGPPMDTAASAQRSSAESTGRLHTPLSERCSQPPAVVTDAGPDLTQHDAGSCANARPRVTGTV